MEVSGENASLVSRSWRHEEVKGFVFSVLARSFDKTTIDDAAIGWVHQATILVLNEKALRDSLIHNN